MKLILLDGISGSGKSSLKHAIQVALGIKPHDYLFVDRWIASNWVFRKMNGEDPDYLEHIVYMIDAGILNSGYVWCDASPETCYQRLVKKGDIHYESLPEARKLFEEYFARVCSIPFVRINTEKPIEECVKESVEWIEKL